MILPSPSADTESYWQAACKGQLLLRYCDSCRKWHHPRRSHCFCGNTLSWRQSSGKGVLLSYTVVHYSLNPELEEQVPYTITLTRLDEGPQIITAIPGDEKTLTCGMPMMATFDAVTPDVTMPRLIPVTS